MLMLDQYRCLLIMWYQCLVKCIFQFVLLLVYRPVLYDSCNNHNKVYRIQMDWQPTAKCILKGTFAIYFTIKNIIIVTSNWLIYLLYIIVFIKSWLNFSKQDNVLLSFIINVSFWTVFLVSLKFSINIYQWSYLVSILLLFDVIKIYTRWCWSSYKIKGQRFKSFNKEI